MKKFSLFVLAIALFLGMAMVSQAADSWKEVGDVVVVNYPNNFLRSDYFNEVSATQEWKDLFRILRTKVDANYRDAISKAQLPSELSRGAREIISGELRKSDYELIRELKEISSYMVAVADCITIGECDGKCPKINKTLCAILTINPAQTPEVRDFVESYLNPSIVYDAGGNIVVKTNVKGKTGAIGSAKMGNSGKYAFVLGECPVAVTAMVKEMANSATLATRVSENKKTYKTVYCNKSFYEKAGPVFNKGLAAIKAGKLDGMCKDGKCKVAPEVVNILKTDMAQNMIKMVAGKVESTVFTVGTAENKKVAYRFAVHTPTSADAKDLNNLMMMAFSMGKMELAKSQGVQAKQYAEVVFDRVKLEVEDKEVVLQAGVEVSALKFVAQKGMALATKELKK